MKPMRNLAIQLVLWLCARYGITVLEEQRRLVSTDAVERGQRWQSFYSEQGGLADMLADIRREAFEVAAEIDPSETDKIYYWAMADRNVRKLEQRIRNVIATGDIERQRREVATPATFARKSVY